MTPGDPKLEALRVVIDQALDMAVSNILALAEEKGVEVENAAHMLSAGLLYNSLQLLLTLAGGDVELAVSTQVSGLNELVKHLTTPAGKPN